MPMFKNHKTTGINWVGIFQLFDPPNLFLICLSLPKVISSAIIMDDNVHTMSKILYTLHYANNHIVIIICKRHEIQWWQFFNNFLPPTIEYVTLVSQINDMSKCSIFCWIWIISSERLNYTPNKFSFLIVFLEHKYLQ